MTSIAGLAARVRSGAPRLGPVRLVCIDGPAGSGKTTLAARLATELGAPTVHLDDLYEGWSGLDSVWPRLEEQVLRPLGAGLPSRWQRYDWDLEAFAEWHDLPVPPVLVVEGSGSAARAIGTRASLVVFVDAPWDVRLARGLERDGAELTAEWHRWQALESRHFAQEHTRARAHVVIDGTQQVPDQR